MNNFFRYIIWKKVYQFEDSLLNNKKCFKYKLLFFLKLIYVCYIYIIKLCKVDFFFMLVVF